MSDSLRQPQGNYISWGLFHNDTARFTLDEEDKNGLPSLRRLYLECEDPTEYEFAEKYLSWKCWQNLVSKDWFQKHITEWRAALDAKLKSRAFRAIQAEAADETARGYMQANRYLADRGYRDKTKKPVGRPQKVELDDKVDTDLIQADTKRLFASVSSKELN